MDLYIEVSESFGKIWKMPEVDVYEWEIKKEHQVQKQTSWSSCGLLQPKDNYCSCGE